MFSKTLLKQIRLSGRTISKAQAGDKELGALKLLPGKWKNVPSLRGRGWNMIALPFVSKKMPKLNYRLLVNQYNEELIFSTVDKAVPNRGIKKGRKPRNTDQFVATIDYEQKITQIAADDFPVSGLAGGPKLAIHHEPGLFLHMGNETTGNYEYARLGTIPHGNSLLALGKAKVSKGAPKIPRANGLPIGVRRTLKSPYLAPYKHFHDNLFKGLFDPVKPNALLEEANKGVNIVRTTELEFDTDFKDGGIFNIPFIEKQADASRMKSKFWIQELEEKDKKGNPKLRLQYTQTVYLDFFPRQDGRKGLIRWPHVSINTMVKA